MGAKTAISDSAPVDSDTIYAQPCVFRALANIQGLDALPCTRRANARDDVRQDESENRHFGCIIVTFLHLSDRRRPSHLDHRVTKKHAQNRNTPGCGLHPLMCRSRMFDTELS